MGKQTNKNKTQGTKQKWWGMFCLLKRDPETWLNSSFPALRLCILASAEHVPRVKLPDQPLHPYCHYKTGRWREKRLLFALLCCMTSAFPLGFSGHVGRHPRQEKTIQIAVGRHLFSSYTLCSAFLKQFHASRYLPVHFPAWKENLLFSPHGQVQPRVHLLDCHGELAGVWHHCQGKKLDFSKWVNSPLTFSRIKLQWYSCYSKQRDAVKKNLLSYKTEAISHLPWKPSPV